MAEKKKLLFVMDGLKIGGVESALISVFHFLDYSKYDVDLLLLHDNLDLIAGVDPSINIIRFSSAVREKNFWFYCLYSINLICRLMKNEALMKKSALEMQRCGQRNAAKSILRQQYDTVIAYKHGEAENFAAFCLDAPRKILFYHHGSVIDDELHREAFPQFDKIVAVSEGIRELLVEAYPKDADKITVIENYVDAEYIKLRANEYKVAPGNADVILCSVGRLSPEKRFDLAIESAWYLKNIGKFFVWYIIGNGAERENLKKEIADLGLTDQVIMLGEMTNPLPYVKACDVYIQTSDVESYGLSMQEALVLGKPVVSTKTIGGNLLIQDGCNGHLMDSDPESIAEAIIECLAKKTEHKNEADYLNVDQIRQLRWDELLY